MKQFSIDADSEFGARVLRRLNEETVIWLVTIRKDMTPQPSPVWFWWNGETLLIFSQPLSQKIRNIKDNNKVALHLDSDGDGGNIVILNGYASIIEGPVPEDDISAYLQKYQDGIKEIDMDPKSFVETYSLPIRVEPYSIRGH
jgi:PPOX class probable F420-dependent enzyme